MKINVYVDGFNLYYGAVRRSQYKWLDLLKMSQLLFPRDEVNSQFPVTLTDANGTFHKPPIW